MESEGRFRTWPMGEGRGLVGTGVLVGGEGARNQWEGRVRGDCWDEHMGGGGR